MFLLLLSFYNGTLQRVHFWFYMFIACTYENKRKNKTVYNARDVWIFEIKWMSERQWPRTKHKHLERVAVWLYA